MRVFSHLGPFVLTTELLPLIKKTAQEHSNVRIVNVCGYICWACLLLSH